jgi:hypothetical protein
METSKYAKPLVHPDVGGSVTVSASWADIPSTKRRRDNPCAAESKSKAGDGPVQAKGSTARCRLLFLGLNPLTLCYLALGGGSDPCLLIWLRWPTRPHSTRLSKERPKRQENG